MKALSYIFLFYVGFYFYRLAENHNKNKWIFGVLGILFFIMVYVAFLLFSRFSNTHEFNVENLISISMKAFSIGFIGVVFFFQVLSFVWSRKKKLNTNIINKIGSNKN